MTNVLLGAALGLTACAVETSSDKLESDRDRAIESLQVRSGAPVALELNEAGTARVLAMTPRFPVAARAADPAAVAQGFVAENHGLFQLDATDATQFTVANVDNDPTTGLRHVSLNRTFGGIPVFQGGISVHMDSGNNVYRVLGDDSYRITAPRNRMMLAPVDAAQAAARAFGVAISPVVAASDDLHTMFTSPGLLDPLKVSKMIVHVEDGDDRFAYQALVSWRDESKQQRYELALMDAQDGTLLASYDLVQPFTGRAFVASPGAQPTTDTRRLVSFDGNPAFSPQGWVGAARTTVGNNAVACTDLNSNNSCAGGNETQPTANASDSFDFPYSPLQDPAMFKPAAVVSAFFLVNDFHDRMYGYGFTESARNFQTSNFGRGGAQNDEVQVDAQDGSSTLVSNFATPPDGSRPRMQLFLFNLTGSGPRKDGDLDPGIIYHEYIHGLSTRLVGGGSGGCLNGIQSRGMSEGWSDFISASILNDPVIGAYTSGNATTGIRRQSLATSPFGYRQIQNRSLIESSSDTGEVWSATLWTLRNGNATLRGLGATTVERLVVQGMKNTPCNPSMLQARDAIIAADQQLNAGANTCALWAGFASRQMGFGASSPNDNSTVTIVLSTAVPPECGGGGGVVHDFSATNLPLNIPDNNFTGITAPVNVPAGQTDTLKVTADVNITHTFRDNLVIQVVAPGGQTATLSGHQGGSADNFVTTGLDIASSFPNTAPTGQWRLLVRDTAAGDVGTVNTFNLHITSTN